MSTSLCIIGHVWTVYLNLLKCCSCLKSIAITTDTSTSQYLEPRYKRETNDVTTCSSFSILVSIYFGGGGGGNLLSY